MKNFGQESTFNKRKSLGKRVSFAPNASVKYIAKSKQDDDSSASSNKKQRTNNFSHFMNEDTTTDFDFFNRASDPNNDNTSASINMFDIPQISSSFQQRTSALTDLDYEDSSIVTSDLANQLSRVSEESDFKDNSDSFGIEQVKIHLDSSFEYSGESFNSDFRDNSFSGSDDSQSSSDNTEAITMDFTGIHTSSNNFANSINTHDMTTELTDIFPQNDTNSPDSYQQQPFQDNENDISNPDSFIPNINDNLADANEYISDDNITMDLTTIIANEAYEPDNLENSAFSNKDSESITTSLLSEILNPTRNSTQGSVPGDLASIANPSNIIFDQNTSHSGNNGSELLSESNLQTIKPAKDNSDEDLYEDKANGTVQIDCNDSTSQSPDNQNLVATLNTNSNSLSQIPNDRSCENELDNNYENGYSDSDDAMDMTATIALKEDHISESTTTDQTLIPNIGSNFVTTEDCDSSIYETQSITPVHSQTEEPQENHNIIQNDLQLPELDITQELQAEHELQSEKEAYTDQEPHIEQDVQNERVFHVEHDFSAEKKVFAGQTHQANKELHAKQVIYNEKAYQIDPDLLTANNPHNPQGDFAENSSNTENELVSSIGDPIIPNLSWSELCENFSFARFNSKDLISSFSNQFKFIDAKQLLFDDSLSAKFFNEKIYIPLANFYQGRRDELESHISKKVTEWEHLEEHFNSTNPSSIQDYSNQSKITDSSLKDRLELLFKSSDILSQSTIVDDESAAINDVLNIFNKTATSLQSDISKLRSFNVITSNKLSATKESYDELNISISNLRETIEAKEQENAQKTEEALKVANDLRNKNHRLVQLRNELIQKKIYLANLSSQTKENHLKYQEEVRANRELIGSIKIIPESEVAYIHEQVGFLCKVNKMDIVHSTPNRFIFTYEKIFKVAITMNFNNESSEFPEDIGTSTNSNKEFQIDIEINETAAEKNRFLCLGAEKSQSIISVVTEYVKSFINEKRSTMSLGLQIRYILYHFHSALSLLSDTNRICSLTTAELCLDFTKSLPVELRLPLQYPESRLEAVIFSKFPPPFSFLSLSASQERVLEISRKHPSFSLPQSASSSVEFETSRQLPGIDNYPSLNLLGGICWWSPILSSFSILDHENPPNLAYNPHSKLELNSIYGDISFEVYSEFSELFFKNFIAVHTQQFNSMVSPRKKLILSTPISAKKANTRKPRAGISNTHASHYNKPADPIVYLINDLPPIVHIFNTLKASSII